MIPWTGPLVVTSTSRPVISSQSADWICSNFLQTTVISLPSELQPLFPSTSEINIGAFEPRVCAQINGESVPAWQHPAALQWIRRGPTSHWRSWTMTIFKWNSREAMWHLREHHISAQFYTPIAYTVRKFNSFLLLWAFYCAFSCPPLRPPMWLLVIFQSARWTRGVASSICISAGGKIWGLDLELSAC